LSLGDAPGDVVSYSLEPGVNRRLTFTGNSSQFCQQRCFTSTSCFAHLSASLFDLLLPTLRRTGVCLMYIHISRYSSLR